MSFGNLLCHNMLTSKRKLKGAVLGRAVDVFIVDHLATVHQPLFEQFFAGRQIDLMALRLVGRIRD